MRETKFIEQNQKKWEEFEQLLAQKNNKNIDALSRLYIEITEDLSYAQTFFPKRSVTVYLNNLSQKIFTQLYKKRVKKGNIISNFFLNTLPKTMYLARKDMLISFLVFFTAVLIGIFSSLHDVDFPEQILGESYIEMTQENIRNGTPMAVYQKENSHGMFWRIFTNNLMVDFWTFLHGLLLSIGSCFILIKNGIMLGAFKTFLYNEGVIKEAFYAVWMHGSVEIPTIIISGAAGIRLGLGVLFPGTYTRMEAFRNSAQMAVIIFLGVIPATLFAALIESYLTRYTEIPDLFRGMFILFAFGFMLFYYVIYPIRKFRGSELEIKDISNNVPVNLPFYSKETIYKLSDSITQGLTSSFSNLTYLLGIAFFWTIAVELYDLHALLNLNGNGFLGLGKAFKTLFPSTAFSNLFGQFGFDQLLILSVVFPALFIGPLKKQELLTKVNLAIAIVLFGSFNLAGYILELKSTSWINIALILVYPSIVVSKKNFKSIISLLQTQIISSAGMIFVGYFIAYLITQITDSNNFMQEGLFQSIINNIAYLTIEDLELYGTITGHINLFCTLLGICWGINFLCHFTLLRTISNYEVNQARGLHSRIAQIQLKTRLYGMEKMD